MILLLRAHLDVVAMMDLASAVVERASTVRLGTLLDALIMMDLAAAAAAAVEEKAWSLLPRAHLDVVERASTVRLSAHLGAPVLMGSAAAAAQVVL